MSPAVVTPTLPCGMFFDAEATESPRPVETPSSFPVAEFVVTPLPLANACAVQLPPRHTTVASGTALPTPFAALSAPPKVPVHEGTGGFTESPQPQGATVVGHAGHEGRSNWSLRRNHAMGSQVHARDSAAWRDVARELYAARVITGVVRQEARLDPRARESSLRPWLSSAS